MSHHANIPPSRDFLDRFKGLVREDELQQMKDAREQLLGATGQFPRGKICAEDEGEIQFAVGSDPETGTVVLDFGKSVEWIGFTPQQAVGIAECLIKHARAVTKEPLTVNL